MSVPSDLLNSNEEVVLFLRPHWWFFARPLVLLVAAIVLGVAVLAWDDAPNALSFIVAVGVLGALGWFAVTYLRWTTTSFIVTTDRLISRVGVLSRSGIEIPLEKINTVFFRQSLFERIIKSGDLEIESASEEGTQDFTDIRRPLEVQNEIYRQMEDNENRKFDRVGKNFEAQFGGGGQTGSSGTIPEQIAQLDDLRQRGILTEAEFETKKAELLRRL
jgi:uncharacterized membrane protein YdbT with pleckstrin-like domain